MSQFFFTDCGGYYVDLLTFAIITSPLELPRQENMHIEEGIQFCQRVVHNICHARVPRSYTVQ